MRPDTSTRILTPSDITELLPIGGRIEAVEAAFAAHARGKAKGPEVATVHVDGGGFHAEIMLPIWQAKGWIFEVLRGGEFVVHAAPEALDSIMPAIRARLAEVAPSVPLHSVSGMDE